MSRSTSNRKKDMLFDPQSPVFEAYRELRTNIQFSSVDEPYKVIMSASAQQGEGKSFTISNLAIAFAQEGKNVLLIDSDLKNPSLHRYFNVSNNVGLTSLLIDKHKLSEVIRDTSVYNLSIITSGQIAFNSSEMLGSQKMNRLINDLRSQYDIILLDSPPVLQYSDALVLASQSDAIFVVVNSEKTQKDSVKSVINKFDHVGSKITGIVLNKFNRKDDRVLNS